MSVLYENRDTPIFLNKQKKLISIPHLHKEIEMVYVEDGKTEVMADRFHGTAKAGDLFIAFSNQVHAYPNCEKGIYHVAILATETVFGLDTFLKTHTPKTNIVHLPTESPLPALFRDAQGLVGEFSKTALCGYMNVIMSHLIPQMELTENSGDSTIFKTILDYCIQNYTSDISLDSLAEELHLSKYYISHIINSKLGFSFSDYINSLRIMEACDLLKTTDKKISDIAGDVGYESIRSFNRIFKTIKGQTPCAYREKHK